LATTNKNFKVKNGLDVNGPIGVGSTPSYGSTGQVLTSQGTGSVPTWTTVSSSGLTATDYVVTGKLSSDQTIASNTNDVLISFVDDFDPQGWWNATSKQFTPNVAGYYNVALHVWWTAAAATTNQYNVQIRKNSSTSAIFQNQTVTGSGSSQGGSRIVYLNGTTDYIDFTAYNGDASTQSLQWGGAGQGTWFSAALMTAGKGDKGDPGDTGPAGTSPNAFTTVSANGTSVVADSSSDTLTITPGDNVQIVGNATSDTITFTVNNALSNITSIVTPNYITFDTTPTGVSTAAGTMYWDDGDGIPKAILNANVTIGLGQESVITVKNATGNTITKGTVVYINGAQGQMPTIDLADADTEATSSKTFGFAAEQILNDAEGFIVTEGVLRGVNTAGFTEGGAIWLSSTAGQYTQTIPAEPAHSVFLGYAVKAHASAGEVIVKIQNGYELTELHGVTIANTAATNDIIQLNSSGIWVNTDLATANIANLAAATNTFTGDIAVNGGDITTNQTTATLYNTTATTVNIGGVANVVNIGNTAHGGLTTINTDLEVSGNITFSGNATTLTANDLVITDPLIYIGEDNPANILDLGIVGSFNNGTYQHTGIVRDASDNTWKLFSNVASEPTTIVDFANAVYDTLKLGNLTSVTSASNATIQLKPGYLSTAAVIEMGDTSGVSSTPAIIFHSGTDGTNAFDSSISAYGGTTTNGEGNLSLSAALINLGNVTAENSTVNVAGDLNVSGTVAGNGSGLTSIPNSSLANSAITINGTSVSLGSSTTIAVESLSPFLLMGG